jgi:pyruvate dehydrogenase E2 component (dihydrolipoamide acetyltransferase)
VRRFARELGADLSKISGTGTHGRILTEDVRAFIKSALAQGATPAQSASGIPAVPEVDFSRWGQVEAQPLSRIKKISGRHLHRAWLNVPHVTHHDEADITELEDFRKTLKNETAYAEIRITLLGFVIKALASAMKAFPLINASLSPDGENLILKRYFHIGVAVDTENGLVVPVLRNVETKGIVELAGELGEMSARARDGKLKPEEMQGGCISISSLGGIGGTSFTPIVNSPEVAILGITRAQMKPRWDGNAFQPRLMLPLDLSYDHRVIDGAEAARVTAFIVSALEDSRRLLL